MSQNLCGSIFVEENKKRVEKQHFQVVGQVWRNLDHEKHAFIWDELGVAGADLQVLQELLPSHKYDLNTAASLQWISSTTTSVKQVLKRVQFYVFMG